MKIMDSVKWMPFVVLLSSISLLAGTVPGRWEKVAALGPDEPVIVTLKGGDLLEGSILNTQSDQISFRDSHGSQRKIAKAEVRLVESVRKRSSDKVVDGAWKGALIGSVVGLPFLIVGIAYAADRRDEGFRMGAGIFGVAVGAGVGAGADAVQRNRQVLYRAP